MYTVSRRFLVRAVFVCEYPESVLHLNLKNFVWRHHVGVTLRGPNMTAVTKRNVFLCVFLRK